jgi:O-antigen/teichoic acid export membrane protein
VSILTASLLLVLIARQLGPATLGLFAGFFAAAVAANGVVELGLSTWLLRELAATSDATNGDPAVLRHRSDLMSAAVTLVILVTAAVLVAGGLTSSLAGLSGKMIAALEALLLYGTLSGAALVLEVGFRASRSVRTAAVATLLEKVFLVALVVLVLHVHAGLGVLAASYLPGVFLRLVFDLAMLRRGQRIQVRLASGASMWAAARAASPFTLNTLVLVVVTRLDVALVAAVSALAAGFYSVADRSLTALIVFPILSCLTLYPHLAGRPERVDQAWRLGIAAAATVAAAGGAAGVVAPWLIPLVFGHRFHPAVHLFQILLFSAPALIYSQMMLVSMFTDRRERAAVISIAGSMTMGTAVFIVCLLRWGATGAAVGAVVRSLFFVVSVVSVSSLRRIAFSSRRKVHPWSPRASGRSW